MIFVTVGTHGQPFERLLAAVAELSDPDRVCLQYGPGKRPEGIERAVAFMSFAEMEENFAAADVVVTHAGVGSILCARRAGHLPIVVPRYRELGEHVDDHQVELTRALAERDEVRPAWRGDDLGELVAVSTRQGATAVGEGAGDLITAVRAALLGA